MYRPYYKQQLYLGEGLIERPSSVPSLFVGEPQFGFYMPGPGPTKPFSVLMVQEPPCLDLLQGGKFFPRYTYEQPFSDGELNFDDSARNVGYHRIDNITDSALKDYKASFGEGTTKEDIFCYVYGLLHSPIYRSEFASDLKKMLPRIPKVRAFLGFADAGRKLGDLHLNYEAVEPYALDEAVSGTGPDDELYRVQKMTFGRGATAQEKDRTRIVYNSRITLVGIPDEAYRYTLGPRSAIEWMMDRYQVRTDKASGIVNDPNDWATEHGEPSYILDLLKRIVTVSIQTMEIVDNLPPLDITE